MALTVSLLHSRMMSSHQGMPEDLSTIVFIERSGGDKTQSYTKSTAVLRLFRFEPYKHTHKKYEINSIDARPSNAAVVSCQGRRFQIWFMRGEAR